MRRIRRGPVEVFNLSFLDIISCAFGAVVLLVLLARNGELETPPTSDATDISILVDQVLRAQKSIEQLQGAQSNQLDALSQAEADNAALDNQTQDLAQTIPKAMLALQQLQDKAQSLRDQVAASTALLSVPNSTEEPDKDVGGIPTDAEYVVFIIDNSGSMVNIGWDEIVDVVEDVITNHPKLKGFNVMAADGRFLGMKPRGWIEDTFGNRKRALAMLKSFQGGGSEPEAGILKAIDTYKNTNGPVSLYVFGDEFSSHSLQHTVERITNANYDPVAQQARFRIHGVGFFFQGNRNTSMSFAAFMKTIAVNNRGAFIALPIS